MTKKQGREYVINMMAEQDESIINDDGEKICLQQCLCGNMQDMVDYDSDDYDSDEKIEDASTQATSARDGIKPGGSREPPKTSGKIEI